MWTYWAHVPIYISNLIFIYLKKVESKLLQKCILIASIKMVEKVNRILHAFNARPVFLDEISRK